MGWGFNGDKRPYHHTPPINIMFAMREALQIVSEEGLENSWNRHLNAHYQLWEGLDKLGLKPFVKNPEDRLATVNCIEIPEGLDAGKLIANAFDKFNLEISGGLGGTAGKVFRIGLMGYNCTPRNVESVVSSPARRPSSPSRASGARGSPRSACATAPRWSSSARRPDSPHG